MSDKLQLVDTSLKKNDVAGFKPRDKLKLIEQRIIPRGKTGTL
jgi:hypothetical protein